MDPEAYDDLPAEPEAQPPTAGELELLRVLRDLIEAVEFEGPSGGVHFNPGTPYELEALTEARRVSDGYWPKLF